MDAVDKLYVRVYANMNYLLREMYIQITNELQKKTKKVQKKNNKEIKTKMLGFLFSFICISSDAKLMIGIC